MSDYIVLVEPQTHIVTVDVPQTEVVVIRQGEQGERGQDGIEGVQGAQGPAGPGVPVGGTTGQVLKKSTDADYATEWGAAAASAHNDMTGRDATDSHPTAAITGLDTALGGKVDKVTGKGLSTEDYTSAEKSKLAGVADNANNYTHPNHSGDVASSGDGATTIANSAVTNAKMANMATQTVKGRNTAESGAPEDLSVATVKSMLSIGNVDNTSDANKPISTAQQTALSAKANNTHTHVTGPVAIDMTFARASIDGALGINVPKFSDGVRVMEATTNILPAGSENFVSGWTENAGATVTVTDYPINIPGIGDVIAKRIQSTGGTNISKLVCNLTGLTNPHTVTGSIWAMSLVGANIHRVFVATSTSVYLTTTMQLISFTGTYASTSDALYLASVNAATNLDIVVYQPQIENKAYATDYIAPGATRAVESLTIPVNATDLGGGVFSYANALISPLQSFSVEFDYLPRVADKAAAKYLFGFGDANNYFIVQTAITSGNYGVAHRFNGGTVRSVNSAVAVVAGTSANHKISVSGSQFTYTLNGVDIGTGTFDGLPSMLNWLMYWGAFYDGTLPRGGAIRNVRIRKGVALSAAERAYTGTLLPDENTTFYSACKHTISSRPFVINSSGVAETLLSETNNRKITQVIPAGTRFRAVSYAANTIDFSYPLPNTMRANPTISAQTETTNYKINGLDGAQVTGFALALLNAGTNRIGFRATKASHGLTDATLELVTDIILTA